MTHRRHYTGSTGAANDSSLPPLLAALHIIWHIDATIQAVLELPMTPPYLHCWLPYTSYDTWTPLYRPYWSCQWLLLTSIVGCLIHHMTHRRHYTGRTGAANDSSLPPLLAALHIIWHMDATIQAVLELSMTPPYLHCWLPYTPYDTWTPLYRQYSSCQCHHSAAGRSHPGRCDADNPRASTPGHSQFLPLHSGTATLVECRMAHWSRQWRVQTPWRHEGSYR